MDLSNAKWRKAGRSLRNGGECIEVAKIPSNVVWRKSAHSGSNGGDCIELAGLVDAVAVRDSKDPDGPVLLVASADLRAAITSAIATR